LKRIASAFPAVAAGLASEYDKEQFLSLRYPAVLPQGSSFLLDIGIIFANPYSEIASNKAMIS